MSQISKRKSEVEAPDTLDVNQALMGLQQKQSFLLLATAVAEMEKLGLTLTNVELDSNSSVSMSHFQPKRSK